jgi:alpha-glucosidase (family GH31 glycosyl hydrolase)
MRSRSSGLLAALVALSFAPASRAEVPSLERVSGDARLVVEIPDDGVIHFEFSPKAAPRSGARIYTTPMVLRREHAGPKRLARKGLRALETAALRLRIDKALCLHVTDLTRRPAARLTTLCPEALGEERNVLAVAPTNIQNLYGLGEHFFDAGDANGDLLGRVITPGTETGNALTSFNGGNTGNAQFPILYALGSAGQSYALFLDQLYAQTWDFTGDPWRVTMKGDAIRGYLFAGADPAELRRGYMGLVGRPPVPPKKMFGLWVSEFGFDSWSELEDKLRTLRSNHLPVDGFVLDLQWFGGVFRRPSHIGALTWDTSSFPDPEGEIARLKQEQGVGLMLIEESYVDASRPELAALATRGYLPLACEGCAPVSFVSWWGSGSMLDWTNSSAADYWHDLKRQPLVEMGILGHWTDLGEPETFSLDARYHGFPKLGLHAHRDIHNIYNFKWVEGIARGYARHGNARRPFVLSRSGTSGLQRFGAAMWSGDIGSNLSSLATQLNVQMHMSFSGIDYFGADIGGYYRAALDGDLNEMYTVWFANAALLDVPVRPHTLNLCNCYETAPDRIGDLASNRENLRLRYRLIPYLYSLAHRAHRYGEPVVPPLPFYYPDDPHVRRMADEKLLGRDLLVATVSAYGQARRDVYLPAGTWINFHTHECVRSAGEWLRDVPTWIDGTFKVPLFARAGAIIPEANVDDLTMNALGARQDGRRPDELIVRVDADDHPASRGRSRFRLYEDDGETVAYLKGAVRTTEISQRRTGDRIEIAIKPAIGTYAGAPSHRDNVVELVVCGAEPIGVTLNGTSLRRATEAGFDANEGSWYAAGDGLVRIRSGRMDVTRSKHFVVRLAKGQSTLRLPDAPT